MNLNELQNDIARWGMSTFGETDPARIGTRMNVEVAELLIELDAIRWAQIGYEWPTELVQKARSECADVFIMLAQIHALLGGDFAKDIEAKMAINRARKWETNDKGEVRHVENDEIRTASAGQYSVAGTCRANLRPASYDRPFVEEGCGQLLHIDAYYAMSEAGGLYLPTRYDTAEAAYDAANTELGGVRRILDVSIPVFKNGDWDKAAYVNILYGADLYVYWALQQPEIAKAFP